MDVEWGTVSQHGSRLMDTSRSTAPNTVRKEAISFNEPQECLRVPVSLPYRRSSASKRRASQGLERCNTSSSARGCNQLTPAITHGVRSQEGLHNPMCQASPPSPRQPKITRWGVGAPINVAARIHRLTHPKSEPSFETKRLPESAPMS